MICFPSLLFYVFLSSRIIIASSAFLLLLSLLVVFFKVERAFRGRNKKEKGQKQNIPMDR